MATGKRMLTYTGPFPRKKHSHKCLGCVARGQINAVACYKTKCTIPAVTETCSWCRPSRQEMCKIIPRY